VVVEYLGSKLLSSAVSPRSHGESEREYLATLDTHGVRELAGLEVHDLLLAVLLVDPIHSLV
jgi:hypothetical protein